MSFQIELDPKDEVSALFIGEVLRALQQSFVDSGLRQQELAEKLDINRSVVNRRLCGKANLTLRSLAEMAWALDGLPKFEIEKIETKHIGNQGFEAVSNCSGQVQKVSTNIPITTTTASKEIYEPRSRVLQNG